MNKTLSARRPQFAGKKYIVTVRGLRTTPVQDVGAVGVMRRRESDKFAEVAGAQNSEGRAVVHQVGKAREHSRQRLHRQRQRGVSPSQAEAAFWAVTEGSLCQQRVSSWSLMALGSSPPSFHCKLRERKLA